VATAGKHLELLSAKPTTKTSNIDAERWDVLDEPPGPVGFLDLHSCLVQFKEDHSKWFVHQLVYGDSAHVDAVDAGQDNVKERKRCQLSAAAEAPSCKKLRGAPVIGSFEGPVTREQCTPAVPSKQCAIDELQSGINKEQAVVAVLEGDAQPCFTDVVVGSRVQVRFKSVLQTAKGPQTVSSLYLGFIDQFDSDQGRHHIKYDDGDEEWLTFPDECVLFLQTGPLGPNAKFFNEVNSNQVTAERKQRARPSHLHLQLPQPDPATQSLCMGLKTI
jgi:hypothetical protein